MKISTFISLVTASAGGFLGYLIGDYDGFVRALVVFVIMDYASGVMRSITVNKKLSSEVGFKGIFKKALIFAMVSIGHIADKWLIGGGEMIRNVVIFFYLSNEGISLLENAAAIGLPVPERLKEILTQLHGKGDKSGALAKGAGDDDHQP